jgi:hypothetical protein
MATKPQAKAAIDSAATAIKADIDNILPVGVNISDGKIDFGPMKWFLRLTAPDQTVAEAWATTMETNLTVAGRPFKTRREGFYVDNEKENVITIASALAVYQITGF